MMDALGFVNNEKVVQVITSYDVNDVNTINILKQNNLTNIETYPRRKNKPRTTGGNGGGAPVTANLALCWEVGRYDLTTYYAKENKWADFAGKPYVLKETASQFKLTLNHPNTLDRHYTYSLAKYLGFGEVIAVRVKDEQDALKHGLINLYSVLLKKTVADTCNVLGDEDLDFLGSKKVLNFLPNLNGKQFISELFKNETHIVHKFVKMVQDAKELKSKMKAETADYSHYLLPVDRKNLENSKKKSVTVTFGLNTIYRRVVRQYPMLAVNPKVFPSHDNYYKEAIKSMLKQAIQYINLVDKNG